VEAPSAPAVPVQPVVRAPVINDAGNVDQFRIALMSVARQYNRYPIQARERGWTGRVEVRLVIGAEGTIESVLVKSSSGYDILDNRALDMIRKAKLQTPVPAALRGREFSIDIPVDFILQTG
jgi:periplasmic protein TonB